MLLWHNKMTLFPYIQCPQTRNVQKTSKMKRNTSAGLAMLMLLLNINFLTIKAQYTMPEVMDTGTVRQQLDYVEERTRIYNDFRAIREDIFQRMKKNTLDTLNASEDRIAQLEKLLKESNNEIANLQQELIRTGEQRDEAVKNQNALSFLGIQMEKKFYNTLMWLIIAALAAAFIILFLIFKRNHSVTVEYKKDLEECRESYESYKKESRERYEKLVVNHHNEIMKLKGN